MYDRAYLEQIGHILRFSPDVHVCNYHTRCAVFLPLSLLFKVSLLSTSWLLFPSHNWVSAPALPAEIPGPFRAPHLQNPKTMIDVIRKRISVRHYLNQPFSAATITELKTFIARLMGKTGPCRMFIFFFFSSFLCIYFQALVLFVWNWSRGGSELTGQPEIDITFMEHVLTRTSQLILFFALCMTMIQGVASTSRLVRWTSETAEEFLSWANWGVESFDERI